MNSAFFSATLPDAPPFKYAKPRYDSGGFEDGKVYARQLLALMHTTKGPVKSFHCIVLFLCGAPTPEHRHLWTQYRLCINEYQAYETHNFSDNRVDFLKNV